MITTTDINRILQIKESFQLPERLLSILLSEEKNSVLDSFMELESDLSFDWFTDYFQEEHSNRSAMMQDFTPRELASLLPMLSEGYERVLDICSGTGGLSIGAWNKNSDAFFVCEELSERALPLLLFNMAVRNVNGYVVNKNVLSGEMIAAYKLTRSDKYSEIETVQNEPDESNYDLVITNPPYSLKYEWDTVPEWITEYGEPPTKAADYAFVIHGLNKMSSNGLLFAILPHGILFRGQKEEAIRKNLVLKNKISGVIGLPDKLFLNTCIPVCILAMQNGSRDVLFVDCSREYQKESKQNRLRREDLQKISQTFRERRTIEKYSRGVQYSEIEYNGYNLNISRYVDTFEQEPLPDMNEVIDDLMRIKRNIRRTELELANAMKELFCVDDEDAKVIKRYIRYLEKGDNTTYEQLTFDTENFA